MSEAILTVSELNTIAQQLLENSLAHVGVEGEISNLSKPSSGHLYFTLKDEKAAIACALFKGQRYRIKLPWQDIENGLHVRVFGRVSLYTPRGQYQLILDSLEATGQGALEREYQALLQKLNAEGLFSTENKKAIPKHPKQIGIITSPSAAALQDVFTTLARRNSTIPLILYPSQVQGETAPTQLITALRQANHRKECDVLLIVRGGGSLEDLWAYNNEQLVRAIAASHIPIISGVGHETDITLTDFAADYRAPTPTAAAETVSPPLVDEILELQLREQHFNQRLLTYLRQQQQYQNTLIHRLYQQNPKRNFETRMQRLDELRHRLETSLPQQLALQQQQITHLSHRLQPQNPKYHVAICQQRLHELYHRMTTTAPQILRRHKHQLQQLNHYLHQQTPKYNLSQQKQKVKESKQKLYNHIQQYHHQQQYRFKQCLQALNHLSPLSVLSRGYAIAQHSNGEIIRSTEDVQPQEHIRIRLNEGILSCTVNRRIKKNHTL